MPRNSYHLFSISIPKRIRSCWSRKGGYFKAFNKGSEAIVWCALETNTQQAVVDKTVLRKQCKSFIATKTHLPIEPFPPLLV